MDDDVRDEMDDDVRAGVPDGMDDYQRDSLDDHVRDVIDDYMLDRMDDYLFDEVDDEVRDEMDDDVRDEMDDDVRAGVHDGMDDYLRDAMDDYLRDAMDDYLRDGMDNHVCDGMDDYLFDGVDDYLLDGMDDNLLGGLEIQPMPFRNKPKTKPKRKRRHVPKLPDIENPTLLNPKEPKPTPPKPQIDTASKKGPGRDKQKKRWRNSTEWHSKRYLAKHVNKFSRLASKPVKQNVLKEESKILGNLEKEFQSKGLCKKIISLHKIYELDTLTNDMNWDVLIVMDGEKLQSENCGPSNNFKLKIKQTKNRRRRVKALFKKILREGQICGKKLGDHIHSVLSMFANNMKIQHVDLIKRSTYTTMKIWKRGAPIKEKCMFSINLIPVFEIPNSGEENIDTIQDVTQEDSTEPSFQGNATTTLSNRCQADELSLSLGDVMLKHKGPLDDGKLKRKDSLGGVMQRHKGSLDDAMQRHKGPLDYAMLRRNGSLDDVLLRCKGSLDDAVLRRRGSLDDAVLRRRGSLDDAVLRRKGPLDDAVLRRKGPLDDVVLRRKGSLDDAVLRRECSLGDVVLRRKGSLDDVVLRRRGSLDDAVLECKSLLGASVPRYDGSLVDEVIADAALVYKHSPHDVVLADEGSLSDSALHDLLPDDVCQLHILDKAVFHMTIGERRDSLQTLSVAQVPKVENFMKGYSLLKNQAQKMQYYACRPMLHHDSVTWERIDSLEKLSVFESFEDKTSTGCRKQCFQALKAVRNKETALQKLNSTHLSAVFLLELGLKPNIDLWTPEQIGCRLLDLLGTLEYSLGKRHLCYPGDDVNVFENLAPSVVENMLGRVRNLRNSEDAFLKVIGAPRRTQRGNKQKQSNVSRTEPSVDMDDTVHWFGKRFNYNFTFIKDDKEVSASEFCNPS